jgi:hypothetical protein
MRARVNSYVGFAFVGGFSGIVALVLIDAFNSLPIGIPPGSF